MRQQITKLNDQDNPYYLLVKVSISLGYALLGLIAGGILCGLGTPIGIVF
jgi:hypothetical protein